jgi:hypothetical protein
MSDPIYITDTSTQSFTTLRASGDGKTATLEFTPQTYSPFIIGDSIVVSSITPIGYQGTYSVTDCTTSSVSYNNITRGDQISAGTITSSMILTSEDMPIPDLEQTLPSFLTEFTWGSFLKSLYDQENADFLFEIYRLLENLYPDKTYFSDILTSDEIDNIFSGSSKIIGHNPSYKFLVEWSQSLNLTERERKKLSWRIKDLETIAYRRKYYGSLIGYEMIFSSLERSGSVYLVGEYPTTFDTNFKRQFRLVDKTNNYKFLPTSDVILSYVNGKSSYPYSGYSSGFINVSDYESEYPSSSISWDGFTNLTPLFSNKTIVLDLSLDTVLTHFNTLHTYSSLLDITWLNYINKNAISSKRITENIKIGSQLNIVVDNSGFYTKVTGSNYTHPDTQVKAFVFNSNYLENSQISKIRLGTAGISKVRNGWFKSIDDVKPLPLFGQSTYDYTTYVDLTQVNNNNIATPAPDASGYNVESEIFESYIDTLEYKSNIYDDYDYVNAMVYSEKIKDLISPSTSLKIVPMFKDSTTINNGQSSSEAGSVTYDFTSAILDRKEIFTTDMINDSSYVISTLGNNFPAFTTLGSDDNTVGTIFTYNGNSTAGHTGTVYTLSEDGNLTQKRINAITSTIDFKRRRLTPGSIDCTFILSPNFIEASTKITKITQTNNPNNNYTFNYGITTIGPVINATSVVAGRTYKILTVGTTNYTTFGSNNNDIGTIFTAYFPMVTIIASSVTASIATLTFSLRLTNPFPVGSTITVSGVGSGSGSSSYNGTKTVTASTKYSVSFASTATGSYNTGTAVLSEAFGNGSVYDIGVHNIVAGKVYKIIQVGTSSFTGVGAVSNLAGQIFKATQNASGHILGSGAIEDLGTPLVISDVTSFEENFWIDGVADEVNPLWQYLIVKDFYNTDTFTWEQRVRIVKKKKINLQLQDSYYDWEDITNTDEALIRIEKPLIYTPSTSTVFRSVSKNSTHINHNDGLLSFIAINNLSNDNYADYLLPLNNIISSSNCMYLTYVGKTNTSSIIRTFSIKVTLPTSLNSNNHFTYLTPISVISSIDSVTSEDFIINDMYQILIIGNTNFGSIGATTVTSGSFETGTEYAITALGDTATPFEDIGASLVNVGSFIIGAEYIIKTPGDSDWISIGAEDGNAGNRFIANNTGADYLGIGTIGTAYKVLFTSTGAGTGTGTAYKTIFTASATGNGTGSASRVITSWANPAAYTFMNNCTKNLADPINDADSSIVGITEMALFNKNNDIVFYSYFPPVIYDSEKNHMSFNVFIKKSSITV